MDLFLLLNLLLVLLFVMLNFVAITFFFNG